MSLKGKFRKETVCRETLIFFSFFLLLFQGETHLYLLYIYHFNILYRLYSFATVRGINTSLKQC